MLIDVEGLYTAIVYFFLEKGTHTFTHVLTHTCTHTNIHTYTHTHTHIYTLNVLICLRIPMSFSGI